MPGLLSLLGDDPSGPHADAAFKLQGAQFAHDSRDGIFSRMRLVHQIEQIVCGDVAVCFGASFNGGEYGIVGFVCRFLRMFGVIRQVDMLRAMRAMA